MLRPCPILLGLTVATTRGQDRLIGCFNVGCTRCLLSAPNTPSAVNAPSAVDGDLCCVHMESIRKSWLLAGNSVMSATVLQGVS